MRTLLLALTVALCGCNNSPPDCSTITQRYRSLCPDDTSDTAANLGSTCVALDMAGSCTAESAALRRCWGADFDGFGGALCGDALFDVACTAEADAVEVCGRGPMLPPAPRCIGSSVDCADIEIGARCDAQLGCISGSFDCEGFEEGCASFTSSASCSAQLGCAWDIPSTTPGSCIGSSIDCADLSIGASCDGQLGCISGSFDCEGFEEVCGAFRAPTSCNAQRGCAWEPPSDGTGRCIGSAIDCRDLSTGSMCDAQLGCISGSFDCEGFEEVCSAFRTPTSCGGQRGCAWEPT